MLTVDNIHSYYDKSHVLEGVSLTVNPGELVTLLGRNGAGKTTTLRSILGIICPRQGQIHFNGQPLVGQKIFEIARQGLALVPENRGIFRLLTVEENLRIAVRKTSRWQMDDVMRSALQWRITRWQLGRLAADATLPVRAMDNTIHPLGRDDHLALAEAIEAAGGAIYAESWAAKDAL